MPDPEKGLIAGRGEKELLPEKGDPFALDRVPPRDLTPEELAELFPPGLEDRETAQEADDTVPEGVPTAVAPLAETTVEFEEPPEDHGLGAVGPSLSEEDLAEEIRPASSPASPCVPRASKSQNPSFSTLEVGAPTPAGGPAPDSRGEELTPAESGQPPLAADLRVRELGARAEVLKGRVNQGIDSTTLAHQLLDRIDGARSDVMLDRGNLDDAERSLDEVEYRINLARRVKEWSRTTGLRLVAYELLIGVLMVAGVFLLPGVARTVVASPAAARSDSLLADVMIVISSMMWGGLGGVVGALASLRRHVAQEQDFDRQWSVWYATSPFMGLALGAVVFLIARAALAALQPASPGGIQSSWLIYAVSFLVGFQQSVAHGLVERIIRLVKGAEERGPASEG